jgi:heme/copper-type cytochrome/quinol oxidase subunit 3
MARGDPFGITAGLTCGALILGLLFVGLGALDEHKKGNKENAQSNTILFVVLASVLFIVAIATLVQHRAKKAPATPTM